VTGVQTCALPILTKELPPPRATPPGLALATDDQAGREELTRQSRKRRRHQLPSKIDTARLSKRFARKLECARNGKSHAATLTNARQPILVDGTGDAPCSLHHVDEVLQPVELMADRAMRRRDEQKCRCIRAIAVTSGTNVLIADRHGPA